MSIILYRVEHTNGKGPYVGSYPVDDDAAWDCHEWLTWKHGRNPVGYPDPKLDFKRAGKIDQYAQVTRQEGAAIYPPPWMCCFLDLGQVAAWFGPGSLKRLERSNFVLRKLTLTDASIEGTDWAAALKQAIVRCDVIESSHTVSWDHVRALHGAAPASDDPRDQSRSLV